MKTAAELCALISRMKPYTWDIDDGYSDDLAEDAITTMNQVIRDAREIEGLPELPSGELDADDLPPDEGEEFDGSEADGQRIFNAQGICVEDYSEKGGSK